VRLYYPSDPTRPYGVYTIPAGKNYFLIDSKIAVGSDWGIRVGDFCPVSIGISAVVYPNNWQEAGNAAQGLTTHGGH
jgi:hypothetical protein